ncbi:BRO-N domain-containing protein [Sodalis glossinidius]|uniref:BRO-N domain-containing protein n=1 Tax=Sodalis glossinidius TaxID=63612 RepID=UPI001FB0C087|nr:BRO family protein [Sodalis glossinidius]
MTIANSSRVASDVLDSKGVCKTDTLTSGGIQELNFVNEPNLYRVIFRSNKPEAKQFQDWVFNDVLPSICKTGKYEHPVYKPESHELFTTNDTSNLARLIWHMSHNFRFKQAWSNGIWYALREVTGIPSPQLMEVRHIPHIARECERIWAVIERLQSAMVVEAERRTIRQLVRKRENVDSVMGEIDSLLIESNHSNAFMLTDTLTRWHKSELGQFAQRH